MKSPGVDHPQRRPPARAPGWAGRPGRPGSGRGSRRRFLLCAVPRVLRWWGSTYRPPADRLASAAMADTSTIDRARRYPPGRAADRRAQRPAVGAPQAGPLRPVEARSGRPAARADDRLRAPARGGGRRPVLVGVRPLRPAGRHGGDGHAGADRRPPGTGGPAPRHARVRDDGRRRRTDRSGRPSGVADRHGGRPVDRLLAGRAAGDVGAGRPLHDTHALQQQPVGRLGHRRRRPRRAQPVRRGGRSRDEPGGHARGPQPRVGRHDAPRHQGLGGAAVLLALVRAGAVRRDAQRARRRPGGDRSARRRGDGRRSCRRSSYPRARRRWPASWPS